MAIGQMIRAKAGQVVQAAKKAVQSIDDTTVNFTNTAGVQTRVETGSHVLMKHGGWFHKLFTYIEYKADGVTVKGEKIRLTTFQQDKEAGELKTRGKTSLQPKYAADLIVLIYQWLAPEFRQKVLDKIRAIENIEQVQ